MGPDREEPKPGQALIMAPVGGTDDQLTQEMLAQLPMPLVDRDRGSQVAALYAGRSVFITGATGFVGKALVEKLIRSCPDIKRIFILVREKRGKSAQERVAELIESRFFDRIRVLAPGKSRQVLQEKLVAIEGDITRPRFGVSDDDMRRLSAECSIVINSAASVRFAEPVDVAVKNNVYSVSQLVELCNNLERLEAIVHLSTAYSNGPRSETIYETLDEPPPMRGGQILEAVDQIRDIQARVHTKANSREQLVDDAQAHDLLGEFGGMLLNQSGRPNTYTLTKAIAETYLADKVRARPDRYLGANRIQVAIVRPSVVCGAWREPLVGLVDNYNAATGVILALYTGALVAFPSKREEYLDLVPVDMLANMVLSTGRFLIEDAKLRAGQDVVEPDSFKITHDNGIYLFNFVAGCRNPIAKSQFSDLIGELAHKYPSKHLLRGPSSLMMRAGKLYDGYGALNHKLPAHLMDFLGHKLFWRRAPDKENAKNRSTMMQKYARLETMSAILTPFTSNTWKFCDKNTLALFESLNKVDRGVFHFNIAAIDWKRYIEGYVIGARIYTSRDEPSSLSTILAKLRRLLAIFRVMKAAVFSIFVLFPWLLVHMH